MTSHNAALKAHNVYLSIFTPMLYLTLVTNTGAQRWLVMTDDNGILETAFPPDDPATYLASPQFTYLGTIKEVLS